MAKKNPNFLVGLIQKSMNKLYQNTYYTQPTNKIDLDQIKSDIDVSLDKISTDNKENTGFSSIASLYNRMGYGNDTDNKSIGKDLDNLFGNKSLTDGLIMSSYSDNKYIKELDDEIDSICKYMPKLLYALDAKRDNVLSSDHFSKDYINVRNLTNNEDDNEFKKRIKDIKEKYNLIENFNKIYDDTSKYGEQYLYLVPYPKALKKLLDEKDGISYTSFAQVNEATITESFVRYSEKMIFDTSNGEILTESSKVKMGAFKEIKQLTDMLGGQDAEIPKIEVEFNKSGILESAIKNVVTTRRVQRQQQRDSKVVPDDLKFEGINNSSEGLSIDKDKDDTTNISVPGCVMKLIPRENILPISIDNICLGFYCIESDSDDFFSQGGSVDPMISARTGTFKLTPEKEKRDILLKYVSGELSRHIDSKFINANQDLSQEIYTILKADNFLNGKGVNRLKVTFIPPEDMIQWYWKKDPKTNRGISDLDKALLPAKLYVALYTTSLAGYLSRGFDKRVYYVKQQVEANISQTLINTINQIKRGNFGSREMTNLKTILNMQGRYNDLVIPVGNTTDPPVQFEIMPGQQIEIKTELLDMFEEMAVSATDIPYEYVNSRQTVDYAVRLTMASGNFIKTTFKRQGEVQVFMSKVLTILYDTEYEVNDKLEVTLPPPAFLNIVNTSSMMENTNQLVQNIVESESEMSDDEYNKILNKRLKRHFLSTYINYDDIDEIKKQTKMEWEKEKKKDDNSI